MIPQEFDGMMPMLAVPSHHIAGDVEASVKQLHASGGWYFDIKWDGIRCLAYIDGGVVKLINRRQVDISFRYPEIVTALTHMYKGETRILDGELVCLLNAPNEPAKPDFAAIHRRDAQSNARSVDALAQKYPATFIPFDLLCFGGDDIRTMPYVARRSMLAKDVALHVVNLHKSPDIPDPIRPFLHSRVTTGVGGLDDGLRMWEIVKQYGHEGLIAKLSSANYKSGRQRTWVKLKQTWRITAAITGYTEGKGSRASKFGALEVAILDKADAWQQIGECGTGFDAAEIDVLKARIDGNVITLVEVELQNMTTPTPGYPFGKMRFPSYKGIRGDVGVMDCNSKQLEGIPVV